MHILLVLFQCIVWLAVVANIIVGLLYLWVGDSGNRFHRGFMHMALAYLVWFFMPR